MLTRERAANVRRPARRRGAILLLVMVIVVGVSAIGAGILNLAQANSMEVSRAISTAQAFWTAEAGLAAARAYLLKSQGTVQSSSLYGAVLDGSTTKGTYSVRVIDDPSWSNAGNTIKKYVITSAGTSQGGQTRIVTLRLVASTFPFGLFGDGGVVVSGGGVVAGEVGSNGDITISGGSRILGNATPGPGHTVNDPSAVTGLTVPAGIPTVLVAVDPAAQSRASTNNNNSALDPLYYDGAALRVGGGATTTLPAGTYYFDEVVISGGGRVFTSGKVIIYCTGAFTVSGGGLLNTTMDPANLTIQASSTTEKITLSGGSDIHAILHAPKVKETVVSGGGNFRGSLMSGGKVTLSGGSGFTADLGSGSGESVEFTEWRANTL